MKKRKSSNKHTRVYRQDQLKDHIRQLEQQLKASEQKNVDWRNKAEEFQSKLLNEQSMIEYFAKAILGRKK